MIIYLSDHLVLQNLLFINNLDSHTLSLLDVPSEFDLSEGSFTKCSPKLVLTHSCPTNRTTTTTTTTWRCRSRRSGSRRCCSRSHLSLYLYLYISHRSLLGYWLKERFFLHGCHTWDFATLILLDLHKEQTDISTLVCGGIFNSNQDEDDDPSRPNFQYYRKIKINKKKSDKNANSAVRKIEADRDENAPERERDREEGGNYTRYLIRGRRVFKVNQLLRFIIAFGLIK